MSRLDDTICAIATPLGEGGVGIIRVSGADAIELVSKVVRLRSGVSLEHVKDRRLYLGDMYLTSCSGKSEGTRVEKSVLDEVLVVAMRSPRSYTGEDVIEIHGHGGPLVLTTICEALVGQGARLAEPGEFTRRAFLNGRLDLTQAEAVLDTIKASTATSLRVAQTQLRGRLYQKVERMRDELIRVLAHLEAGMDFVEEDLTFISREDLKQSLAHLIEEMGHLIQTAEEGRYLREGVLTAIIGRPNVGKSSLLNAFLESDRAIVSTIPGTTRDVLEEVLNIHGVPVRLVDTAGLRQAEDTLEVEGIRRTREAIERAELLLIMVDSSSPLMENDIDGVVLNHPEKKRLLVLNKSDLPSEVTEADVQSLIGPRPSNGATGASHVPVVWISAKTGEGMDMLRKRIRAMVLGNQGEPGDSAMITRLRHKVALERAREAMVNTMEALEREWSGECLAVDLRIALDALGEIIGVVSTDDILDQVFREFCIGK